MKTIATYVFALAFALGQIHAAAVPVLEARAPSIPGAEPENLPTSTVAKRADFTPVPVSEVDDYIKKHGLSAVTPRRSNDFTPVPLSEVEDYIKKHGIKPVTSNGKRSLPTDDDPADENGLTTGVPKRSVPEASVEISKRGVNSCLACMAGCGANQAGINLLTIYQKIGFCMSLCMGTGACNYNDQTKYQDSIYSDQFPPAPPPGGFTYAHW